MKRDLLDRYNRQVPVWIRRRVPGGLIATSAGLAYRRIPHPDLAFVHARHLAARGRAEEAGSLYQRGGGTLEDPLFDCRMTTAPLPDGPRLPRSEGGFRTEFCYAGVKILIALEIPAQGVDILIDGFRIRHERLARRDGRSRSQFTIRRSALALFNPESRLTLRLEDGRYLTSRDLGAAVALHLPNGSGDLADHVAATGTLEKKGYARPTAAALAARQEAYLSLYADVRNVFARIAGTPLMIVCGTLLGQHRSGGFIPGDDDFDVGYVSDAIGAEAVKRESVALAEALAEAGFRIVLNRAGKPFRIARLGTGLDEHLDVTPIFADGAGNVLLHKLSCLRMPLADLRATIPDRMRGTEVEKPRDAADFLAAYYGPGWAVPDPGFSYANRALPKAARAALAATHLDMSEQRALVARMAARELGDRVIPLALEPLYPLPPGGDPES